MALATANCSSPPRGVVASSGRSSVDPRYGVTPSPRVIGENEPVPKGGGRDLVGRPYVIAGRTYVPRENPRGYVREGLASWYGSAFHGRLTANGEIFDRTSIAAAHPTLPLPSYARVTNIANNRSMIVRVNDRGPYHADRLMDVSQRVAEALDFKHAGTSRVRVEYVAKASLRGSDDTKLLATLRTDGRSAPFPGQAATMFADAGETVIPQRPPARTALAFRDAAPEETEAPVRTAAAPVEAPARTTVAFRNAAPEESARTVLKTAPVAERPIVVAWQSNTPAVKERALVKPLPVAEPPAPMRLALRTASSVNGSARAALHAPSPTLKPPVTIIASQRPSWEGRGRPASALPPAVSRVAMVQPAMKSSIARPIPAAPIKTTGIRLASAPLPPERPSRGAAPAKGGTSDHALARTAHLQTGRATVAGLY